MANTNFPSEGLLGAALDQKYTTALLRVGTVTKVLSDKAALQGKFAMYVKANGVIGNSSYVTVDLSTLACFASSVEGGAGTAYCRNGSVAFADGEFGWVYVMRTAIFQT